MLPSAGGANRRRLEDLTVELVARANRLAAQLHPDTRDEIGALVRSMNCYYSNLIEGHHTHPADIERALRDDYSHNPSSRALQLEARAHIEVQAMLDTSTAGKPVELTATPTRAEFIRAVHRELCSRLPAGLLSVENPTTGERIAVVPGELRRRDVKVGRHVPVSPGAVARFLSRFEAAYRPVNLSRIEQIVSVPSAHHRLLWIHPFIDGNGRVARLLSHAMFRETGVGTSLWSVSRGLARHEAEYKRLLMSADEGRRGDSDGRGALSEAALTEFCDFFLRVCVDQVEFMETLLDPGTLMSRIEVSLMEHVAAGSIHPRSMALVREAFQKGSLERGRVSELTGLGERQGRNVLSRLISSGVMTSTGHRDPVRLAFPSELAERWFPNLYPALPRSATA